MKQIIDNYLNQTPLYKMKEITLWLDNFPNGNIFIQCENVTMDNIKNAVLLFKEARCEKGVVQITPGKRFGQTNYKLIIDEKHL